uniref:Protein kinase domain-containing protein n=1 Tax=Aegilops tauschii subsp. strangulata TaxID=200361 RepID=A0A453DLM7_AEGTS
MEHKATTARSYLEQILVDETAEPTALPLSLLKDITGDFSDDQEIGRGGFAVVYKGIFGDKVIAVKKLSHAYMHETEFDREIECLMRAKHKNVVRFLGYCDDTQRSREIFDGKHVMAEIHQRLLCFEYVRKESLDKYINGAYREWGTCYKIIKGICEGLQYLHDNHIIHLDLKPANILLDDNMEPKIADFGLSRCFDENQSRDITKTILGTIGYLAPEIREGGVIARSADLYSVGVIMLEILTGQKGYQDIGDVLESWSDRLERSQRDTLCEQIRVCYEIALECREFNPKMRPPSARDIIDRLHTMESIQVSRRMNNSKSEFL